MNQVDYKSALEATRAMMENMQTQNRKFVKALEKYAHGNWKDLTLFDQGKIARSVLGVEIK